MNLEKYNSIKQSDFVQKLLKFFESSYFFIVYAVFIYLLSIFRIELIGFYIIAIVFAFLCIFSSDIFPFTVIVLLTFFAVSLRGDNYLNSFAYYGSAVVLPQIIALFAFAVTAMVIFVLRMRKQLKNKKVFTPISISLFILSAAVLFNGINIYGSSENFNSAYRPANLIIGGITAATLLVFYFFFSQSISFNGTTVKRFAQIIMCAGLLMSAQIMTLVITRLIQGRLFLEGSGEIDRFAIVPGWTHPNPGAAMLVLTIPLTIYLAAKEKHSWLYCLCAVGIYAVSALLLSRNALLIGGIVLLTGLITVCIKGSNRKSCIIFLVATAIIAFIAGIVMFNRISQIFQRFFRDGLIVNPETGELADNNRFNIWKQGIALFKKAPIFGGGFSEHIEYNDNHNIFSNLYHNIFIQFLAACGIVGLCAFLFHFGQLIRICVSKINLGRFFLGLSVLLPIILSLVDNNFFHPNFLIFYGVFIAFTEQDYFNSRSLLKSNAM